MCQMSVVVEKEGVEQERYEDVTSLTVEGSDVKVATLFAGASSVKDAVVRSIDFMGGVVLLQKTS